MPFNIKICVPWNKPSPLILVNFFIILETVETYVQNPHFITLVRPYITRRYLQEVVSTTRDICVPSPRPLPSILINPSLGINLLAPTSTCPDNSPLTVRCGTQFVGGVLPVYPATPGYPAPGCSDWVQIENRMNHSNWLYLYVAGFKFIYIKSFICYLVYFVGFSRFWLSKYGCSWNGLENLRWKNKIQKQRNHPIWFCTIRIPLRNVESKNTQSNGSMIKIAIY